jgi:integrase
MSKSTRRAPSRKATWKVAGFIIKRPYPDFPLSPHPSGKWQKRIRTELRYFGNWAKRVNGKLERVPDDGWEAALAIYKAQADDLHAGRTPRAKSDGLTVADLCNRFLTAKQRQYEAGELSARMYCPGPTPEQATGEYKQTTDRLDAAFGKTRLASDLAAEDFEALRGALAEQFGPVRLGNEIQKVRTVFKYAYESGLLTQPIRYGPTFKKPSKKVMRVHRAEQGPKLFTADEIRSMIGAATQPLKAMILLGINAALGNNDCGQLPLSALELDTGWIVFPRPKTGIDRKAKLWPETIAALREAIADRPEPKDATDAGLVFITKYGHAWEASGTSSPVTHEFGKLLRRLKINGRTGLGFYGLRHTLRTVADATKDVNAIRRVMGHTDDGSIDATYIGGLDDARLVAVAEHVRSWLWPSRIMTARTMKASRPCSPNRRRRRRSEAGRRCGCTWKEVRHEQVSGRSIQAT